MQDMDARGIPWDSRIHSRTKSKTAAGNWKTQRGVAPSLIKQVEAELGAVPQAAPASVLVKPQDVFRQAQAAEEAANPFPKFMSEVTALANTGRIAFRRVIAIVQSLGFTNIAAVSQKPERIPEIMTIINSELIGAA